MPGYSASYPYTATGLTTDLGPFGSDDVTYVVTDNGSNSSTSPVQVKVGTVWVNDPDYAIGVPRTFEGPIDGLRLNITSLGTATTVTFSVTARGRYG